MSVSGQRVRNITERRLSVRPSQALLLEGTWVLNLCWNIALKWGLGIHTLLGSGKQWWNMLVRRENKGNVLLMLHPFPHFQASLLWNVNMCTQGEPGIFSHVSMMGLKNDPSLCNRKWMCYTLFNQLCIQCAVCVIFTLRKLDMCSKLPLPSLIFLFWASGYTYT